MEWYGGVIEPAQVSDVEDWLEDPNSRFPEIKVSQPVEITCYSRDSDGNIDFGSRKALRKIVKPCLPADLNPGFESFVPKDYFDPDRDGGVPLGPVVQALQAAEYDIDGEADFVTLRNSLVTIALTPYQLEESWEILALQLGSTIFLGLSDTGEERVYPNHMRYTFYGYSFESLCYGEEKPCGKKQDFLSVVRLEVGRHRLLLAAEIDGFKQGARRDTEDPENASREYVELKTTKKPGSPFATQRLHRYKFPKYWIQSFLAGVPTVMLGLRNEGGRILNIEEHRTFMLPYKARASLSRSFKYHVWEKSTCMNHLNFVLGKIRRTCGTDRGTAFIFKYDAERKSIYSYPADYESAADFVSRMSDLMGI